jgi:hypothetical protein
MDGAGASTLPQRSLPLRRADPITRVDRWRACSAAFRDRVGRRWRGARWKRPSPRSSTSSARPWPPASTRGGRCRRRPRAPRRLSRRSLGQAIRATELGSGAGHALATAARAEGLTELALAGEALDLAETTGAPPGPVLAGVATAAADRVRARQARLAATAQARLSARVVAAMAPAFLGILALTSPTDAAFLIREPFGWAALTTAIAFELLGICWSARIVRGPSP